MVSPTRVAAAKSLPKIDTTEPGETAWPGIKLPPLSTPPLDTDGWAQQSSREISAAHASLKNRIGEAAPYWLVRLTDWHPWNRGFGSSSRRSQYPCRRQDTRRGG